MTVDIKGLGKITASKEVLNKIALAFYKESDYYKNMNHFALSEYSNECGNIIYDALEKYGYYD